MEDIVFVRSPRNDGKCPRCVARLRRRSPNGNVRPYCEPCGRSIAAAAQRRRRGGVVRHRRDGLCPMCNGERPKEPGRGYCMPCRKRRHMAYKTAIRTKSLEAVYDMAPPIPRESVG